ncbi:hypothetical protein [Rhizobium binxianense]
MTYRLSGLRDALSRPEIFPETPTECREEAQPFLLRAMEVLHAGALSDAQRQGMAEALALQMQATAVLRRFALGNDDAPGFVRIATRDCGDA